MNAMLGFISCRDTLTPRDGGFTADDGGYACGGEGENCKKPNGCCNSREVSQADSET